ncbi:MAG: hypothetical protein V3S51_06490 [Dehalococcoidia bacterium]
MNEKLIGILEDFAEKTEEQAQRDKDAQRKAFRAGKAEGLRLARDLVEIISENGHGT